MYILKNAWLSITRNKGRNILMGIIIFVVAVSTCIALAIRSSATKLVSSYNSKYDVEATLGMNRENMMKTFNPGQSQEDSESGTATQEKRMPAIESLSVSEIEKYGDSKYVKNYHYTYRFGMNSSIEALSSEDSNERGGMKQLASEGDFTVIGYDSYESMSDFISGKYTISEGAVDSDFTSNTCVISSELAVANDLSVGNVITLINPNDESKTYELKISGIYQQTEETEEEMGQMFSGVANTIITNKTVSEKIKNDDDTLRVTVNPTFVLTSENVIDQFSNELEDKGLSDYYQVQTNLDTINSETASIQNVSHFASVFLVITLIIGGIVLFVLNMINVRERKYEIGVLRTIGMKKSLVVIQFVTELFIVTLVALILGTGVGSLLSVPTANYLLENEISSSQTEQQEAMNNFGSKGAMPGKDNQFMMGKMNGIVQVDKVTSMNAVVDIKVVLELFGIGLLLTLISSVSSMIGISRFSPLTILRERS